MPMESLVSKIANRSPALGSGASNNRGILGMHSRSSDRSGTGKPVATGAKDVNDNAASSSQVWHLNENTPYCIGKPCAKTSNRLNEIRLTHHDFQIFNVDHLEKVFSNVRQKLSRLEWDEMLDVEINGMIWRIFISCQRQ